MAVRAVAAEPLSQLEEHPEEVVLLLAELAGLRQSEAAVAATAPEAATAAAAAKHVSACFNKAADS